MKRFLLATSLLWPLAGRAQVGQGYTPAAATAAGINAVANTTLPNAIANGAACNGAGNDTAAITATLAQGGYVGANGTLETTYVRPCLTTTTDYTAIDGAIWGQGRIADNSGRLIAPYFFGITSAPAAAGGQGSPLTMFNGDWSHSFAMQSYVSGAATMGQPSSGYLYTPNTTPIFLETYYTSGWNQSLTGNGGRTGFMGIRSGIAHAGNGDATDFFASGNVTGTQGGATTYQANASLNGFAAGLNGGANGTHIELIGDLDAFDNGFDIDAQGVVVNLNRTVGTGALNASWAAFYGQSTGAVQPDDFLHATGAWNIGLDMAAWSSANLVLQTISLANGGSGCTAGDVMTASGGTAVSATQITIGTCSGGAISTWTMTRSGVYTIAPGTTTSFTGPNESSVTFTTAYAGNALLAAPAGSCFYMGALNVSTLNFPNTVELQKSDVMCFPSFGATLGNSETLTGGTNTFAIGQGSQGSGSNNLIWGNLALDRGQNENMLFAGGDFASKGDAQRTWRVYRITGTGGSVVRPTANGGAAGAQNCGTVPAKGAFKTRVEIEITDQTANGNIAGWKSLEGVLGFNSGGTLIYNGDTATALIPNYSIGTTTGALLTTSADTTNNCFQASITLPTGTDTWLVVMIEDTLEVVHS